MAIKPTTGKLGQPFGVKNSAYRLGYHPGDDYLDKVGTPVKATLDGTAGYLAGYNGGYGNVAYLILSNGDVIWQAHQSRKGATGKVKKGAVIGYSGATGWVTGPHSHIEYRIGGNQNKVKSFDKWLKANPEKPTPAPLPKVIEVKAGEGLAAIAKRAKFSDWTKPSRWQAITDLNKKGWTWQKFNASLQPKQKVRVRK